MTELVAFDPRGRVEVAPVAPARRPASLAGLRVAVLDNTKWNGGRLLEKTLALLDGVGEVRRYKKESFSRNAAPELIARIAAENDLALTAIGD